MTGGAPAIPGYELLHEVGRGGMGVVWLARQVSLDRHVALKVISAAAHDAMDRARFRREDRLVQQLSHSGVARLLDHDPRSRLPVRRAATS